MALQEGPFGTYANVTGVVNTVAAPEIAALFTEFYTLMTQVSGADTGNGEPSNASPDWNLIPRHVREQIKVEIDAIAAAIAAAPTV